MIKLLSDGLSIHGHYERGPKRLPGGITYQSFGGHRTRRRKLERVVMGKKKKVEKKHRIFLVPNGTPNVADTSGGESYEVLIAKTCTYGLAV
jgi:hypothetical protein